jgi:hypothetical protein
MTSQINPYLNASPLVYAKKPRTVTEKSTQEITVFDEDIGRVSRIRTQKGGGDGPETGYVIDCKSIGGGLIELPHCSVIALIAALQQLLEAK